MHATLTMDDQGRVALPQDLREELHLAPGDALEMEALEGEITLRPVEKARFVYEGGFPVLYGTSPLPLSIVEDTINQIREERDLQKLGILE